MRKKSANWYIAATHYLTAGFVIPILMMLFLGLVLGFLPKLPSVVKPLIHLGAMSLAIWLGTIYSANFLKKRYIIKDKNKIVNLATGYLIVIDIIWLAINWLGFRFFSLYSVITSVIMAVVFYLASKKYIKETSEEMS
jgi:membrane protein implicated in regulation of membrane protease activity